MSLSEIVAEIQTLKVFAEENVDAGPVETLAGRRGRQLQAKDTIARLTREYKSELLRGAIIIIVTGASRDEFTKVATEKFGAFSANPEEFYGDLVGRIPQALYVGKETASDLFDILGRHLEDKMSELDVREYPQLIFKEQYNRALSKTEDFVSLVKQAINEQVGSEIVGIQAVNSLVPSALERNHAEPLTAIILSTDDDSMVASLNSDLGRLSPRVFVVASGKTTKNVRAIDGLISSKDVTEDGVKATLSTIRKALGK